MLDIFSRRLKELMELEGVSNRALSIAIKVDRASIRLWLNGRFYPRYDALIKLAAFFRVRIDGLVGLEPLQEEREGDLRLDASFKERAQQQFFIKLSAYIEEYHLTKYAIAKRLNIDPKSVAKWLKSGSVPETATIIRLSQMTHVSIDELFGWRGKENG